MIEMVVSKACCDCGKFMGKSLRNISEDEFFQLCDNDPDKYEYDGNGEEEKFLHYSNNHVCDNCDERD